MRTVSAARASAILYNLAQAAGGGMQPWLLPANVCPVVPLTLLKAGRTLEFIDIDRRSLCMDPIHLARRLADRRQPRVAAVVHVRTYGTEADAGPLFGRIRRLAPDALLVDDRCLCRPEPDRDRVDPQGADVVLFSTGHRKYVDLGGGGFAHLADDVPYCPLALPFDPAELARVLALCRRHVSAGAPIGGTGPVTDEAHAGALRRVLSGRWLECRPLRARWHHYRRSILDRRREMDVRKACVNARYADAVPERFRLPAGFHRWRFQLRVPGHRDWLFDAIVDAGLFASTHYYPASRLFGVSGMTNAQRLSCEIINLFNDTCVNDAQVTATARLVGERLAALDES